MNKLLKISVYLFLTLLLACQPDDGTDEPNNTYRLDEYQSNWQKRKLDDRPLSDLPGALPGMYSRIVSAFLLQKGDSVVVYSNRYKNSQVCYFYSSYDKGLTWFHQSSLYGTIIHSAHIQGDTVYALREYMGSIEFGKSLNSGFIWTWSAIPSDPGFLCFANSTTGLSLSNDGIYKSSNGGNSWIKISSDTLSFAKAINDSTFIGISGFDILKSIDGGNTWTQKYNSAFELLNIYKSDQGVLYAGGYSGSVFRSFDEGESWTQIFQLGLILSGAQNAKLNSFCMVDSLNGFAAISFDFGTDMGSYYDYTLGIILRTANAGESWIANYYTEFIHYTDIFATSGPVIMSVGTQEEDNVWSGIYITRTQTLGN
ncbi:MAG: hypothetical protein JXR53_13155 [Bacteroidales bacterium]|nr:hypothetical protein [Bacteroidales bacterium]